MHAILFFIYFALLCLLIKKIKFFRDSEIRLSWLLVFFTLRVLASCINTWLAEKYFPNQRDIWSYFREGLVMKGDLLRAPLHCFKTLLPPFNEFSFFDMHSSWYLLEFKFISGINTFFDFLSFDNFYINSLLFSFFVYWGSIALFRVFRNILHNNGLLCSLLSLLIPSTLFWTACINKEGVIYMSLGFFSYYLHRALTERPNWRLIVACILFLALGLFSRPFLIFGLFPFILFWIAGEKIPFSIPAVAALTLIVILIVYYFIGTFYPNADPFLIISDRQQDILVMSGRSRIHLPSLEPNPGSFLAILPTAFLNGFIEPLPGHGGHPIYLLMTLEMLAIWTIILTAVSRKFFRTPKVRMGVYDISCLFMAIPCILLAGYSTPFISSISRYRSIYLPFLLVPFVHTLSGLPFVSKINKSLSKIIA
ncbi:MAG: hypothetical protein P4L51_18135 [Puia sp.]|nr:hypothetical protein [Puia sp.]